MLAVAPPAAGPTGSAVVQIFFDPAIPFPSALL